MKIYRIYLSAAMAVGSVLWACDEGRIYEPAPSAPAGGVSALVEARLVGVATWPASYTVSIAAFEEGNDYALLSKPVGSPADAAGTYSMSLADIPAETSTVEICVVDRLRRRVASFHAIDCDGSESYRLELPEDLDVSMYNVIQTDIFNTTCVNCHGRSGSAAAGLFLTSPQSYSRLVGVESKVMADGSLIVESGSRGGSVLYLILSGSLSQTWLYDHSVEVVDPNALELIGAWIDNGTPL